MSLINQMLRDLEARRRAKGCQLPGGEEHAAVGTQNSSRRALIVAAIGVLLIGLVWSGLKFFPQQPPAPPAAAVEAAAPLVTPPPVTQPVRIKTRVASGDFSSTLLNLGVLETGSSVRLMFEFERLPEYRWQFLGTDKKQLRIQFKQSGTRPSLTIPHLNGPLLKRLSLQSGEEYLQLFVESSQKLNVQTLELPADPFHGHRLLVELFVRPVLAGAGLKLRESAAAPSIAKAAPEKEVVVAKKVSKQEQSLGREEQAMQAYRAALRQLQGEDLPAAEATLSHALILQPRLLAARLQLIALLQQLRRHSEAEKQLVMGLQLHPDNPDLRKNYARQLLTEGQLQDAIDILQSEPRPEVGSDLEYYALLAALQQEAGQHEAAVKSYTRLLNYRSQEALWWMGLAISFEQSEDFAKARKAYRRAISLPGLRPDLQDYIHSRLQVL